MFPGGVGLPMGTNRGVGMSCGVGWSDVCLEESSVCWDFGFYLEFFSGTWSGDFMICEGVTTADELPKTLCGKEREGTLRNE